jgi:D-threonate/D-erythronate kinase
MTRLAIVADDLTGALDAAAPFAARGVRTVVALGVDDLGVALASGADVVGVSTDSREIPPDAARRAVAECMGRLPRGLSVFKKIDSRLKGNIAAELDAIPHQRALVVPAIPAFGRRMRNGRLEGFGVAEPIDIAMRLGRHAGSAVIPDIDEQGDIDRALADVVHDLPVGARGLAEALAMRLAPTFEPSVPTPIAAPVLCVIGSTDPITIQQVERLRGGVDVTYIAAPDGEAPAELPPLSNLTVLQATPGAGADPVTVARRLGEAIVRLHPPAGATLVLSGGATAQVVLRALGIGILDLRGEALPGLPIARAGGFTIITKSGGFGEPDALLALLGHPGEQERGIGG